MKAVLYIRVSHEDQVAEGHSLAMQEDRLRAYCAMRGLAVADVVIDAGVSAGKPLAKRPGGARVVALVKSGEADAVVAWKLDRLFRNVTDCLTTIERWDANGVSMHLVDLGGQAVDTSSAMGRFFLTVMAAAAALEREQCGERIKAVKAHERAKGSWLGGKAPYGYHLAADGGLEPDEAEQGMIAMARRWQAEGLSLRKIGAALAAEGYLPRTGGQWHAETVKALLAAEVAA